MPLHLVANRDRLETVPHAPFDLAATPLRPGVAHDELALVLDPTLAERVERRAATTGLPGQVWAGLAIESERAVAAVATGCEQDLARVLDDAATAQANGLLAHRARRLVRYGLAIRTTSPRPMQPVRSSLRVVAPQQSMIAWELAAAAADRMPERWAADVLAQAPVGRELWEAAAATSGLMLGEWVAVQAARFCRA